MNSGWKFDSSFDCIHLTVSKLIKQKLHNEFHLEKRKNLKINVYKYFHAAVV